MSIVFLRKVFQSCITCFELKSPPEIHTNEERYCVRDNIYVMEKGISEYPKYQSEENKFLLSLGYKCSHTKKSSIYLIKKDSISCWENRRPYTCQKKKNISNKLLCLCRKKFFYSLLSVEKSHERQKEKSRTSDAVYRLGRNIENEGAPDKSSNKHGEKHGYDIVFLVVSRLYKMANSSNI